MAAEEKWNIIMCLIMLKLKISKNKVPTLKKKKKDLQETS